MPFQSTSEEWHKDGTGKAGMGPRFSSTFLSSAPQRSSARLKGSPVCPVVAVEDQDHWAIYYYELSTSKQICLWGWSGEKEKVMMSISWGLNSQIGAGAAIGKWQGLPAQPDLQRLAATAAAAVHSKLLLLLLLRKRFLVAYFHSLILSSQSVICSFIHSSRALFSCCCCLGLVYMQNMVI